MSAGYHHGYQQPRRPMPPQRPVKKKARPGRVILVLLLVLLLAVVGFGFYVDSTLKRIDALPDYEGRPADTPGTTWLLVGSDSRDGLTQEQKDKLAAGDAAGSRTDSIMMLHLPDNSAAKPVLLSIPRDSYVAIEGNGRNKINAAFSFGGPQLLVKTVEGATGVRIDHYMEIGFAGFSNIVDAVGGVDICLDQAIKDPMAGIDLPAGCQELDGPKALGFVRTRYTFATSDLQRVQNQRKFLSALFEKVKSPATLANPFRLIPLMNAASGSVSVNKGDHVWNLASVALNISDATSGTVPVGGTPTIGGQSVVQWNKEKASQLFDLISKDQPVPAELIAPPK